MLLYISRLFPVSWARFPIKVGLLKHVLLFPGWPSLTWSLGNVLGSEGGTCNIHNITVPTIMFFKYIYLWYVVTPITFPKYIYLWYVVTPITFPRYIYPWYVVTPITFPNYIYLWYVVTPITFPKYIYLCYLGAPNTFPRSCPSTSSCSNVNWSTQMWC